MPKSLDAFARRYLYEFMDARDLINFGRTCKSFYGECMHASAWKGRAFLHVGRYMPILLPDADWQGFLGDCSTSWSETAKPWNPPTAKRRKRRRNQNRYRRIGFFCEGKTVVWKAP